MAGRVLLAAVALWFLCAPPALPVVPWYSYWPARQDRPVERLAWPGLVARIQGKPVACIILACML